MSLGTLVRHPLLQSAGAILIGAWLGVLAMNDPGVLGVLAGLPLVVWLALSPRRAFFGLLGACALNHWTFSLGGGNLRPEHFALAALLGGLGYEQLGRGAPRLVHLRSVTWLVLGWLAVNAVASWSFSPDRVASLKIVVWVGLSFLMYLGTLQVVPQRVKLPDALDALIAIGGAVGVFGLVVFVLYQVGISLPFIQIDPITNHVTTFSTMWEANIFGSFEMMVASLAFMRLSMEPPGTRRARWLLYGLLVSLLALLISFTRAAWLGAMVALGLQMVQARGGIRLGRRLWVLLAALGVAIGAVFALGAGRTFILRALSLNEVSSGSFAYRLIRFGMAYQGFFDSPWLGNGTNSFGQRFLDPSQNFAPDYLPSLFLQALYDSGLIGFGILMALFGVFLVGLWRRRLAADPSTRAMATGLGATLVAMLIAYQTTSAFWFGYTWVLLGLIGAFLLATPTDALAQGSTTG